MKRNLTNLDLYLNFPAKFVGDVNRIEDVTAGMNPVYYAKLESENRLLVSSSVISLIKYMGDLNINDDFIPNYNKVNYWPYYTTIDGRINRLKAFESIDLEESPRINFCPYRWRIEKDDFIDRSIDFFKHWIRYFEKYFSDRENVVYVGGRDSRIILLLPKKNPSKWHIFSSNPNAPIVKEWLNKNDISIQGEFFTHSNINDDNDEYLLKKVINSDYLSSPFHLRWARKADSIANHFDKKCIFWLGNAGDTIYACRDESFKRNNYRNYFDMQFSQTPSMQGIYMQMVFNMTECPAISLYAAPGLWKDLYQYFEPAEFDGQDLRPEMGNRIANRRLDWSGENPCPTMWKINSMKVSSLQELYINHIKSKLCRD